MEARMHHDPFGAQPWGNLDIGLEVMLDGVGDIGRYFSDIDRRGRVKAEVDGVPFARSAHAGGARVVEAAQHIGAAVELDVYQCTSCSAAHSIASSSLSRRPTSIPIRSRKLISLAPRTADNSKFQEFMVSGDVAPLFAGRGSWESYSSANQHVSAKFRCLGQETEAIEGRDSWLEPSPCRRTWAGEHRRHRFQGRQCAKTRTLAKLQ
jgi:hypothetical protein